MTKESSSHRHILWATSLIGGATLGALIIGLARNKAVALIGGPAAIGLLGLFTAIVSMGSSAALFGLNTSAVRQLSRHADDPDEAARTRRAIWTLVLPLAVIGGAGIWLARNPLASFSAGSSSYATAVGWLSLGVIAAVLSEIQLAVMQSYGRIADLARVRLWGSLVATVLGVLAVFQWGLAGIVVAVIASPVIAALLAFWLGRNLPPSHWRRIAHEPLADHWSALARIGAIVMLTSAVASATQLSVRALITHQLNLDAAGLFHAASSIMWVNLSLVLNAMAADYYPRIAKADGAAAMSDILNSQLHVTLMLAAPALAATCALAPLALTLLYSSAFADSSLLLRLLTTAAVLRVAIWALGFILLARGSSASYLLGELTAAGVIPMTWLLLPQVGLDGAGYAAIAATLASFFFYGWRVRKTEEVRLSADNWRRIVNLFALLSVMSVLSVISPPAGLVAGLIGTAVICWRSYRFLKTAIAS